MQRGTDAERELIRHAIEHGEVARLAEIVDIVRRTGALEATRDAARAEADNARRSLDALPASPSRDALLQLCARSVERASECSTRQPAIAVARAGVQHLEPVSQPHRGVA